MPKRSLATEMAESLDRAVTALLRPGGTEAPADELKRQYPGVAALIFIARDLRDLPRIDFKARLKSQLERTMTMASTPQSRRQPTETEMLTMGGYHTLAPYMIVPRAAAFIDFLKAAFDGVERFRVGRPDAPDLIMHAEVSIGNSIIELSDANQQFPPAPTAIHLYVDDADVTYRAALAAGARSIYEPGDHPSGDHQGAVRDAVGNIWYIATASENWAPVHRERLRTVQVYLHLNGADKMIAFLQNAFGATVEGHVPLSPEGKVLHATIRIGDNTLEVDEAHGEFQPMRCHMHLHVPDADSLYARAVNAGATSIEAPNNKPYGRSAGVKDAFGNSWFITTPLSATPKP